MKIFFEEFVSKSRYLIAQNDYRAILKTYKELIETIVLADNVMSYPMFTEIIVSMLQLFWFSFIFVSMAEGDFKTYVSITVALIQGFAIMLMVFLPAAFTNEAAIIARDTVVTLPTWFPQHYTSLKKTVRQRYLKKVALSLWKIYIIDKPLIFTALGTLLTYGVLLGTLGKVQSLT
ncbi:hypothetical protein AVEN_212289-1 [Araneus ventricosus]|uniref:Uncharacterized protein n=1 Tax=Araneus ventricosus TaxID=182803 RepID=A0A4Y2X827_ARAVE|nr:hypothetical protein AVEN_224288-1 [Araneus ventricosus]GBO45084.1 hypothetical protein AVEN_212289-1 [Araneus ventricosus]